MPKKRNRTFVIIGLGTVGSTVATDLARNGNHVMGIDIDEKPVAALSDILSEAIIADGRDEEVLREVGVDKYDVALIAIGDNLEANLLCTMNVKMLGVKTVWVKAINKTHHRILTKLEPDRIILPEQEIGTDFIDCQTGSVTMAENDKILILGRRENLRDFSDGV